jgi:uncharacterized protein YecT (DUF1311 family)
MKTPAIALALLLGGSISAHAGDKIDCKSQDLNQMQLDQCAGMDFTAADAKLNALYKTLMAKYDAANGAKLKTAERAWIAWRDAECDYETNGTAGGTINPMEDAICLKEKNNQRIQELNRQLNCNMENDMTCNPPVK